MLPCWLVRLLMQFRKGRLRLSRASIHFLLTQLQRMACLRSRTPQQLLRLHQCTTRLRLRMFPYQTHMQQWGMGCRHHIPTRSLHIRTRPRSHRRTCHMGSRHTLLHMVMDSRLLTGTIRLRRCQPTIRTRTRHTAAQQLSIPLPGAGRRRLQHILLHLQLLRRHQRVQKRLPGVCRKLYRRLKVRLLPRLPKTALQPQRLQLQDCFISPFTTGSLTSQDSCLCRRAPWSTSLTVQPMVGCMQACAQAWLKSRKSRQRIDPQKDGYPRLLSNGSACAAWQLIGQQRGRRPSA
mmetsp:Transcript_9003/g.21005  ORF Transcript_9003/g.21005 Transcript_9003/m.21005 type:complete len:292 (+) Transcript_9003:1114-1989(+)